MLQTLSCYFFSFAFVLTGWACLPIFGQNAIQTILSLGSACYLCFVLARILNRLLPRRRVSSLKKAVFITGCDTGFGHLLAKRLDSKGFRVFAGCLLPNGPDTEELKQTTSSRLSIVPLDVASDESVQNALRNVKELLGDDELWAVVNNAGILIRGECEWTLIESYKKLAEVNTFGMVRVIQAFLPLLRKFKGRVIATTSYAGRQTFAGQVPYSMSKYAANAFCDGLRQEMKKWGVKVITVEPFAYRTPMTNLKIVLDDLDRRWSKAPEHVKEFYGVEYIEDYKKAHANFNEFACDDCSQVTNSLEEAVAAYSPHDSYTPGDLKSTVGFWFLRRLPSGISDIIIARFITCQARLVGYARKRMHHLKSGTKVIEKELNGHLS